MQSSINYSLLSYVTSDFESHSLLNVIYIVADAMTAAVYIPTAKVMDVWGRAEGFLAMTGIEMPLLLLLDMSSLLLKQLLLNQVLLELLIRLLC